MKISVGISSCLLGEKVRYDGGHKQNIYIQQTLGEYFEFHSFCPEIAIGLGVPRKPIRLVRFPANNEIHCVSTVAPDQDFTDDLTEIAGEQSPWHRELCGYILKAGSPSCGMRGVKVGGTEEMEVNDGTGIYAAAMMKNFPNLPVEEEGRLGDSRLRENFVQRVFIFWRWQQLVKAGLRVDTLKDFHARHELIVMSHDHLACRALGQLIAGVRKPNLEEKASEYIGELMKVLQSAATVSNPLKPLPTPGI